MDITPRLIRPVPTPLAAYVRLGRNDHKAVEQLLLEQGPSPTGLVFDPCLIERHAELRSEARRQHIETILDPRSLELSSPGGLTRVLSELPWGDPKPHECTHLMGNRGDAMVNAIAKFTASKGFSAVLSPTHLIRAADDPWLEVDGTLTRRLREQLDAIGLAMVPIYYPLIIHGSALRIPSQRDRLIANLDQLPLDAIWLRVHPFGVRSSGPIALRGYIEACRHLHRLHVPLVGERTGTIGLALLAFGAVGGIENGVTFGEGFEASKLQRPSKGGKGFLPAPRVYLQALGTFLEREQARAFLASRQMRSAFACQNQNCCRHGAEDMISNPKRHFLLTRLAEVAKLSRVPPQLRTSQYLDDFLRPASDLAVRAANFDQSLQPVRKRLESWRQTLTSFSRIQPSRSSSEIPEGHRILRRRGA